MTRPISRLNAIYRPKISGRRRMGRRKDYREFRLRNDPLYGALEALIVELGGAKWGVDQIDRLEVVRPKKFAGKSIAEIKKTPEYKKAFFAFEIMQKIEQNKLTVAEALNAAKHLWPRTWRAIFPKYLLMSK